jgi:hypothetical protein
MARRIVDLLEAVQVDKQQRKHGIALCSMFDCARNVGRHPMAIRQAGERIFIAAPFKLCDIRFGITDIAQRNGDVAIGSHHFDMDPSYAKGPRRNNLHIFAGRSGRAAALSATCSARTEPYSKSRR